MSNRCKMNKDKYIENRLCAVDKILQHTVSDKDMCIMDNAHRIISSLKGSSNDVFPQRQYPKQNHIYTYICKTYKE